MSAATSGPGHDAEILNQPEPDALGQSFERLIRLDGQHRLEQCRKPPVEPVLEAARHLFRNIRSCFFIDKDLDLGRCDVRTPGQPPDGQIAPHQPALFGQVDLVVGRIIEPVRTQPELGLQCLNGSGAQSLGLFALGSACPVRT